MIYKNQDCLEFLKSLDDNVVDLICTDPPYYRVVNDEWDNQWFTIDEYYDMGLEKCISLIYDKLEGSDNYFTFDIDGIDPTFAPGTGTPEVGGFTVREAQVIIRLLNKLNFIGGDVVEVSPPFDNNNMTSHVAATIAFEMLCTMTKTN